MSFGFSYQADRWNRFYVNLAVLSRILHLFVRLGNVFGVWKFHRHLSMLSQKALQSGDGSNISPLSQFDPEDHKAGIGIASAHIFNESDLIRGMLVGMTVWTLGTICKGLKRAVIAILPAVDVLTVGLVANGSFGNAVFLSIQNHGLPKPYGLCYSIHSE